MTTTLMIDVITSLDGYGSADGWPGWWGLETDDYLQWLGEQVEPLHLMGATTYRTMQSLAEAGEPGTEQLARMHCVVYSSTLEAPLAWPNAELVAQDAVEHVRGLKETETRPLATLGSLTLAASLLKAGLVDRYRVVVFPVVTGSSGDDPVYPQWPDVRLHLVESRAFAGGAQLLEFEPELLDGPLAPGAARS